MREGFPTTPRAPTAVRLGALAIAVAVIALASRTTITSVGWIGLTFPGFMLLDNRVVASVGLAHWSGAAVDGLYQSEVVAVDGVSAESTAAIYARIAKLAPGTPVAYRLRRHGAVRAVTITTQRFTSGDWF